MSTAQSNSMPQHRAADSHGAWPVLARLPDVTDANLIANSAPADADDSGERSGYRFDPPAQARTSSSWNENSLDSRIDASVIEARHTQPPAPHLMRHAARSTQPARASRSVSPALPAWDPFAIPSRRFSESLSPIVSFLVLVALFTAAGTSILMLRTAPREPITRSSDTNRMTVEQSVAGPTAKGPGGRSTTRLEPLEKSAPTAAINSEPKSNVSAVTPSLGPASPGDTASDTTTINAAPTELTTGRDGEDTKQEYPAPVFPTSPPPQLPHAQTTDYPPAVARFSGVIGEVPTRQAQHDDQSILH